MISLKVGFETDKIEIGTPVSPWVNTSDVLSLVCKDSIFSGNKCISKSLELGFQVGEGEGESTIREPITTIDENGKYFSNNTESSARTSGAIMIPQGGLSCDNLFCYNKAKFDSFLSDAVTINGGLSAANNQCFINTQGIINAASINTNSVCDCLVSGVITSTLMGEMNIFTHCNSYKLIIPTLVLSISNQDVVKIQIPNIHTNGEKQGLYFYNLNGVYCSGRYCVTGDILYLYNSMNENFITGNLTIYSFNINL